MTTNADNPEMLIRRYYNYPITVVESDATSIANYRQRDGDIVADSSGTRGAASDRGSAVVNSRKEPLEIITFEAVSDRAHNLQPGDAVTITRLDDDVDGTFVITDKRDTYDGVRLTTEMTATEVGTL